MMKKAAKKPGWLRALAVFLLAFLILNGCAHFQVLAQKREAQLTATYTAESTVRRISAQLNEYLAKTDLLAQIVSSGYEMTDGQFTALAGFLKEGNEIIESIELAKGGVVSRVYPIEGNQAALGLDLFSQPDRVYSASRAMTSREYTIAGPFELVQGGTGALLFDPIYMDQGTGVDVFWGFSLLVLNWDRFIDSIQLDKLEDADYYYEIWKTDPATGARITLARAQGEAPGELLEVACEVPNDVWYFAIAPSGGWVAPVQLVLGAVLAVVLALLVTLAYWQRAMRRYKDKVHEAEMARSAAAAQAASQAKTRFLFNMSHDIRTPMNAIIGFTDLLDRHLDDRERAAGYVEKIRTSSSFLLSIINHVLEMARIESGRVTLNANLVSTSDLIRSLDAVFEPAIQEKGLTYACTAHVDHEYVICDRTKIREIFLNIISNSVKYTPAGGRITVDITEVPTDEPEHAAYRITVADTGIGISPEYLPHIFEEFSRERTSTEGQVAGTGLGLPIVKALLDLMGGTIDVESRPGQGTRTTILLTLPVAEGGLIRPGKAAAQPLPPALHGTRLLLAEDNDLNAEIAVTLLEESGFAVERVEDGAQALAAIEHGDGTEYAAVLMDIQMPHMDGYQATRAIRALPGPRGQVPIVAMTANAFAEDRARAMEAGMNAYISKPIQIDAVLSTLEHVLGEAAPPQPVG